MSTRLLKHLRHLNLTCRDAASLVSDQTERPLLRSERAGLFLHLLICRSCRAYRRSVRFLRRLMLQAARMQTKSAGDRLPAESRRRIRRSLEDR